MKNDAKAVLVTEHNNIPTTAVGDCVVESRLQQRTMLPWVKTEMAKDFQGCLLRSKDDKHTRYNCDSDNSNAENDHKKEVC
jgi:hypothetical protein